MMDNVILRARSPLESKKNVDVLFVLAFLDSPCSPTHRRYQIGGGGGHADRYASEFRAWTSKAD
jgi:hypothetical protein